MKAEVQADFTTECQVACGKKSCVVLYKGEHCLFCTPADKMLREELQQFRVPESAIREIDVGLDDSFADEVGIVALPTIEICDEFIVGLPQEGSIRDAIVRAAMKECFCE